MGKEGQGQRPKRLQVFVDRGGEEEEGAKQSWPLACPPATGASCHPRIRDCVYFGSPFEVTVELTSIHELR